MRPFGRILILAACILAALVLSAVIRSGMSGAALDPTVPYHATLGTPQPYPGGTTVAYRITLDDEKLQPFLAALAQVDRTGLGFRSLSSDVTYDLSLNFPNDRAAEASLVGNADAGSVAISFILKDGAWHWSGEELLLTGPGHYWMGWDEGYWREGASFSCFGSCAAAPDIDRITVAYSGTSDGPVFPWDYLVPQPAIGRDSLSWREAKDRMDSWWPRNTAP